MPSSPRFARQLASLALVAAGALTHGSAQASAEANAGRLTTEQFALLAERLHESGSLKVRLQAALLLGAAGGPEAVPLLVQSLHGDATPTVRAAAALALGQTQDGRAFAPLVEALDNPDPFLREQAEKALARLAGGLPDGALALWERLAAAAAPVQQRGLTALGAIGAGGVEGLLAAVALGSETSKVAAQAELARLPPEQAVAGLRAALHRKNPDWSPIAAAMLADRGDPTVLPALADAASDPSQPTAVQAEARSGLLRLTGAIDPDTEARRFQGEDPQDRVRAVVLLAIKGGPAAEALALRALQDPNLIVQATGASALADLGAVSGLAPIQALLNREEEAPILRVLQIAVRRLDRKRTGR